jgi:RNA polymerase sigma-70 factor (ECF subfamily)
LTDTTRCIDAAAFEGLYEAQCVAVLNYARFRLGPDDGADAAADAFARAWARRGSFDPDRGAPEAWLWAIVRTSIAESGRSRQRWNGRLEAARDLAHSDVGASGPDQDLLRDVVAIAARLKSVDAEILALRFGAAHTNRDIAAMLGLSEANVAQRLRRALDRIRGQLEEQDR